MRRPPRSTPLYSSAASDVYKRQHHPQIEAPPQIQASPTDSGTITRRRTMSTQTISVGVQGMTCGHCVRSVTEELTALAGVGTSDLAVGGMTCASCVARVEKKINKVPGATARASGMPAGACEPCGVAGAGAVCW